jgi:uncharacterized protein YecE (DUF72 family)
LAERRARRTAVAGHADGDNLVHVGCSGWQYQSWRGRFYPAQLPASQWLRYYTETFDTVEVNNTFYRLPPADVFADWRERTPVGFVVTVKASRYLTHMKKLLQPARPLRRLFTRAARLQSRLGPMLYQLPADLRQDVPRLVAFLEAVKRVSAAVRQRYPSAGTFRHVVEFRHPSWYTDEVFTALADRRVSLCLHDKAGSKSPRVAVGPFVYVRFHGPLGTYQGAYSGSALRDWATWLARRRDGGSRVFAYFNNDPEAAAPRNALQLRALLRKHSR